MSDNESIIPEEEIPKIEKKPRKKKEMTPEMLEQLRLAREKSIEIKKAMKNNPEIRVEHYKEKIKKQQAKPTKKQLLEQAKKELNEEKKKEPEVKEPEVKEPEVKEPEITPPEVEGPLIDDELDENGLPKPPKQVIKKPIITQPEPEPEKINEINESEKKKKVKKVKYIYESDTESEEEIVYVKKNHKKYTSEETKRPIMPTTFGGNVNRFGSYGMFGRRI